MKIIDDRTRCESERFKLMATGATFFNANGHVCLKISDESWFDLYTNKLVEVGFDNIPYELVDAELVLKDHKGEDNDNGRSKATD